MNKPETVTEAKRNTLIRAAVGLLQHERTSAVAIEMLGAEPHSFIAIGTAAEIAQLLREDDEPATAASHPARRLRHGDRPTEPLSWDDAATSGDAPGDLCQHRNGAPSYTHWNCLDCGAIKTDGEWGVASRMWFPSVEVAKFYQQHGRMPEPAARIERAAAPAPSELTMRRILEIASAEFVDDFHMQDALDFARAIEREVRAAAPAPTTPFAWMKPNEIDGLLNATDKATSQGEPVRQYGRIYARQYDADMVPVCAAAPATASGDELPPLPAVYGGILDEAGVHKYATEYARAAVSAATKPTAGEANRYRFLLSFLLDRGVLHRYENGVWRLRGIYGVDDSGLKGAGRTPEEALDNAIIAVNLDPAAAEKFWRSSCEDAATKPAPLDLSALSNAVANAYIGQTGEHLDAAIAQAIAKDALSLLATKPAAAPEGAAVDANGTTYHNIAEIYHQAEECTALHMWLDDQGVPRADAKGKVFSPVGRVMGMVQDAARFRWLNADHDDADVREQARSLAKRLGTSSYFAITRDIDAAMLVAAPAAPTAAPAEQVRNQALEEAAEICDDRHHNWRFGNGEDSVSGPKECAALIRALKSAPDGAQGEGA